MSEELNQTHNEEPIKPEIVAVDAPEFSVVKTPFKTKVRRLLGKVKAKAKEFAVEHKEIFKFLKFMVVGLGATIVEFAIYYILQFAVFRGLSKNPLKIWFIPFDGIGLMLSFIISTTIGYVLAFIFNRKVTFAANSNPLFSAIAYFVMVIFTIFATTAIGSAISTAMTKAGAATAGEVLAKPIAAALAFVWTYPTNRFVVHRKKKAAPEAIHEGEVSEIPSSVAAAEDKTDAAEK